MNDTIINDYGTELLRLNKLDLILQKITAIETRQMTLEGMMIEQIDKNLEIKKYLEENREKYLNCLEKLNSKEDNLVLLLNQTKNVLSENRLLYGQSFDSILQGERQLRDLLIETKKILNDNQEINARALKVVCDHDETNHRNLNDLKLLLHNYNLKTN